MTVNSAMAELSDRLIKLIISAGYWLTLSLWHRVKQTMGGSVPATGVILYYHSIFSKNRKKFARQLDDLIRVTRPVAADFPGPWERGTHYATITFDDGFVSVLKNAVPELMKRKIPATIFIPTGYLGKSPGWAGIKQEQAPETVMTAAQLKNLPAGLISIGSHTVTHADLTSLTGAEANRELVESKACLEALLGKDIELFSFPHGSFNQELLHRAGQAGYKRVFSILPTRTGLTPDGFVRGRVSTDPQDWSLEFRLKLLGAYGWLPVAYRLKQQLRRWLNRSRAA